MASNGVNGIRAQRIEHSISSNVKLLEGCIGDDGDEEALNEIFNAGAITVGDSEGE